MQRIVTLCDVKQRIVTLCDVKQVRCMTRKCEKVTFFSPKMYVFNFM